MFYTAFVSCDYIFFNMLNWFFILMMSLC